jgi:hypothetical protein
VHPDLQTKMLFIYGLQNMAADEYRKKVDDK